MTKRKSAFSVVDVKRAVAAVSGSGLTIFGVTISIDGSIHVATAANDGNGKITADSSPYEQWKSKRKSEEDD